MTDGMLLREFLSEPDLASYSVMIIGAKFSAPHVCGWAHCYRCGCVDVGVLQMRRTSGRCIRTYSSASSRTSRVSALTSRSGLTSSPHEQQGHKKKKEKENVKEKEKEKKRKSTHPKSLRLLSTACSCCSPPPPSTPRSSRSSSTTRRSSTSRGGATPSTSCTPKLPRPTISTPASSPRSRCGKIGSKCHPRPYGQIEHFRRSKSGRRGVHCADTHHTAAGRHPGLPDRTGGDRA
eukprot:SAG11_NODE_1033_length_6095_cov_5.337725_6_plen_235_part_00